VINADTIYASALAALPGAEEADASHADTPLPTDIQVFPPGQAVEFTLQDYPNQTFQMDIDESVAEKANADLQTLLAKAGRGEGALPFADKNHEDAEATFRPLRYFWGGKDPKKGGVRVVPDWTPFGAALVKAKAFKYYSQNFLFSRAKKKFLGLINENVGGLVNRPGFSTQAAFAKADSALTPIEDMTTEDCEAIARAVGAAVATALVPLADKITSLAKASLTATNPPSTFEDEVMASHAKGMTLQEAAQAVSYRRPDLFDDYRRKTVFCGKTRVAA
jgi:hypothetical protein